MSLDDFYEQQNKLITLNVGGTIFETYSGTLINRSTYFKNLLLKFKYEDKEVLFLDKDPEVFKHVLGYLRNLLYPFPWNLRHELEWFGIELLEPENVTERPIAKQVSQKQDNNKNDKTFNGSLFDLVSMNEDYPIYKQFTFTEHSKYIDYLKTEQWKKSHVSSSCAVKIAGDVLNNDFIYRIPRYSDAVKNIVLEIKIKLKDNMPNMRYKLFDKIDFVVSSFGVEIIHPFDVNLLEALEDIELSKEQKEFNGKFDKHHTYIYTIPLYFTKNEYNCLPLNPHVEYNLYVRNSSKDVDFATNNVVVTYITMDTNDRKILYRDIPRISFNRWSVKKYPIEAGKLRIDTGNIHELKHVTNKLLFFVKPLDGPFVQINNFKMNLNNHNYFDIDGNIMLYDMAQKNMFADKFIYQYEPLTKGEQIRFMRFDTIDLTVELFEPLDVASELYLCWNHENIMDVSDLTPALYVMD